MSDVMQCPHCSNHTIVYTRAHYDYIESSKSAAQPELHRDWAILQCPVCLKPIFVERRSSWLRHVNTAVPPQVNFDKEVILFPVPKSPLANVPESVTKAYSRALKVRNIEPNACAMWLGRTLEAVCKHENVPGNVLAQKLKKLADSGRIPPLLADMALSAKEFRNLGAHEDDSEDEVSEDDVPVIFDLVDAVLEYMYVAPAKVDVVKKRLGRSNHP